MLYHPVSQRKRTTIISVILLMLIITGLSAILTIAADQDCQHLGADPYASLIELRRAHVIFAVCISFLFFCLTLTLGLTVLWFMIEIYFFVHRRRLMSHASSRVVAEARQRSLLWGASVLWYFDTITTCFHFAYTNYTYSSIQYWNYHSNVVLHVLANYSIVW